MEQGSFRFMARWSARVLGAAFLAIVLLFFLAHAFAGELPRIWQEPVRVQLDSVALLLMAIGGVVGWKWPALAAPSSWLVMQSGNSLSGVYPGLQAGSKFP